MIGRLTTAIVAATCALGVAGASAQGGKSHLQRIFESGTLRVGTTGTFVP